MTPNQRKFLSGLKKLCEECLVEDIIIKSVIFDIAEPELEIVYHKYEGLYPFQYMTKAWHSFTDEAES